MIIIPIPGHTLGHQILLVRLKEQETLILSGDCIPCRENLMHLTVSRNNMDNDQVLLSIQQLRKLIEKEKVFLIHGHDPLQWKKIEKAPEYY